MTLGTCHLDRVSLPVKIHTNSSIDCSKDKIKEGVGTITYFLGDCVLCNCRCTCTIKSSSIEGKEINNSSSETNDRAEVARRECVEKTNDRV